MKLLLIALLLGKSRRPVRRCIAPICRLAFKRIVLTWLSNVRFSSMQIPNAVMDLEKSIYCPLMDNLKSEPSLLPFNKMPWNFAGFACIAFSENHWTVTSASAWRKRLTTFHNLPIQNCHRRKWKDSLVWQSKINHSWKYWKSKVLKSNLVAPLYSFLSSHF